MRCRARRVSSLPVPAGGHERPCSQELAAMSDLGVASSRGAKMDAACCCALELV